MPMPHKGPRDAIYAKPTIEAGLRLRREAADRGIKPGELISILIAERYNLPATNEVTSITRSQQELPMTG